MTVEQIRALAPALAEYLGEFSGCFVTPETCLHLREYVQGQLSDLPRKSVEPMADLAGVAPRTLQEFLSLSEWDQDLLRGTVQRLVARDHADAEAIGVVDESGHPKKGEKTACVQRQYCGNNGKVDNCVMSVHLAYASYDTSFRCMLDCDLFLPESWDRDKARRESAEVPKAVRYRPKYDIALEQLDRARANGVRFGWVTADEWYGGKPKFVQGLEQRGERFVLEVPANLMGWLHEPAGAGAGGRGEVQNLCRWSTPMLQQPWVKFHVKDTGKGAVVWEARAAPFWMKRGKGAKAELVGPYWLIAARDVMDRDVVKYFLSNAKPGTPLEAVLHVAFARWPVERCLEDQKTELGMSHFECRKYGAVLRHLLLTLVSYLFLARQCQLLRGGKRGADAGGPDARGPDARGPDAGGPDAGGPDAGGPDAGGPDDGSPAAGEGDRFTGGGRPGGASRSDRRGQAGGEAGGDGLPSARRRRGTAGRDAAERGGPGATIGEGGADHPAGPGEQRRGPQIPRPGAPAGAARRRHPRRSPPLLHPAVTACLL